MLLFGGPNTAAFRGGLGDPRHLEVLGAAGSDALQCQQPEANNMRFICGAKERFVGSNGVVCQFIKFESCGGLQRLKSHIFEAICFFVVFRSGLNQMSDALQNFILQQCHAFVHKAEQATSHMEISLDTPVAKSKAQLELVTVAEP